MQSRIYDCFIFNDELDIVAARMAELYNVVERFVVVEGTKTFTGHPKPLHFKDNLAKFQKYLGKISHVVVDDWPLTDPWGMERHQRDSIMRGLTPCREGDAIVISDADEIPTVEALQNYKPEHGIMSLNMAFYYYDMHTRAEEDWQEPKILPYGLLKKITPCGARYAWKLGMKPGVIMNGGRHLSFFGDVDAIIKKLEAYAHTEYNTPEFKNRERIQRAIDEGLDLFGRSGVKFRKV